MTKKYCALTAFLIIFVSVFLFFTIPVPSDKNFTYGGDEVYYFRYAKLFSEKGMSTLPGFLNSYVNNPEARFYPTPSRVGFILLTGIWLKIFDVSFLSLDFFSYFCYLLFLITCFFFSRKIFGKEISYLFVLLLSSSPLIMAMGRRALTDSCSNLFWALSLWTYMVFLLNNNKRNFFIFLLIFTFNILIKESALFLMLFFVVYFFISKFYFKKEISNSYLAGIIFLPLGLVGLSWVILFGGFENVKMLIWALFDAQFITSQVSLYTTRYCMGPWYKYLIDFLLLNPIVTLLFIGYFFHMIMTKKNDWKEFYFFTFFNITYLILANLKYIKNVRYAITLEMVMSLFSVLFLIKLFEKSKFSMRFVFWACVAIFFINIFSFYDIFCIKRIYDPISINLLIARRMIPVYPEF